MPSLFCVKQEMVLNKNWFIFTRLKVISKIEICICFSNITHLENLSFELYFYDPVSLMSRDHDVNEPNLHELTQFKSMQIWFLGKGWYPNFASNIKRV